MICINVNFLARIGLDLSEADKAELIHTAGGGLAFSPLFSFGGAGNGGRDTRALQAEPEPRRLTLVAMADRYGAGSSLGAAVVEICTEGPPTSDDARGIAGALETCTHPMAARIRDRLLQLASPATSETLP
jgi:hypothetical protein